MHASKGRGSRGQERWWLKPGPLLRAPCGPGAWSASWCWRKAAGEGQLRAAAHLSGSLCTLVGGQGEDPNRQGLGPALLLLSPPVSRALSRAAAPSFVKCSQTARSRAWMDPFSDCGDTHLCDCEPSEITHRVLSPHLWERTDPQRARDLLNVGSLSHSQDPAVPGCMCGWI